MRPNQANRLILAVIMLVLAVGCQRQPTPLEITQGAITLQAAVDAYVGRQPTPELLAAIRSWGPQGETAAAYIETVWAGYQASTRPAGAR